MANLICYKDELITTLQMNKNGTDRLPPRQSTKSIQKFKTLPIEQRIHMVSTELLGNARYPSRPKVSRPSIAKPAKKTEEELLQKIRLLEAELQRKLNSDGLLRNFFKTLNSSDISRIDIYLQLKKCEEIIQPLQARLAEESEKCQKYLNKIENLEKLVQQKEQRYIENIVVLESQFDENYKNRDKQLNSLRDNATALRSQLETNKMLLGEVKKKNESLAQEAKSNDKRHQKLLKELEQTRQEMQERIDELELKKQYISLECEDEKSQNRELLANLQKCERNKIEMTDILSTINEELQRKNKEIIKLKQIINAKENKVNALQQNNSELEENIGSLKQAILNLNKKLQKEASKHIQTVQQLESENTELKKTSKQLQQRIQQFDTLQTKSEQSSKSDRTMIKELKDRQEALVKYYENERAEMMVELKREKFHDIENQSLRKRYQLDQAEKDAIIAKLQNKISSLLAQSAVISKRLEESQRELEKCRGNEKINEKLSCENYKTAGRLLEIKKQIMLVLTEPPASQQEQGEESLERVTSSFAKAVYSLILQSKASAEKTEAMKKHLSQRIKQLCSLLHHFKAAVDIDNIDQLIERYTAHVESVGEGEPKGQESISETYHLIIQKLINGEKSKKFITEPSINIVNDSLDNVILKENQRESVQKAALDKRHEQSIRLSCNSQLYAKSRQSEYNKQNVNTANDPQRFKDKIAISYNSVEKYGDSSTAFRRSSGRIRSEIERKYFRS